ncbi:MAG: ATP-dependent dethiobiotin synthetase [Pseudomonadota bacterium]|jgi:dethiobiotin synthetase
MSLKFGCFVTGTDTNVGKTLIASALLHRCVAQGWRAVGMKPVAAGCTQTADGRWCNEDVEALCAAASVNMDRVNMADINPYLFREAIAPHLAARHEGVVIEMSRISASFVRLKAQAEAVVVEGAGGFVVPLNGTPALALAPAPASGFDSADLARELGLPLVLTVGMRLGCINHALLTQEAIVARGLTLAGWVANRLDPAMPCFDENLATLQACLRAPLLGVVPYMAQPDARQAAEYLELPGAESR